MQSKKYLTLLTMCCTLALTNCTQKTDASSTSEQDEETAVETVVESPTTQQTQAIERTSAESTIKKSAEQEYLFGHTAHNAGDFNKAIEHFTKGIAIDANHANCWGFRGLSKFKSSDVEGACIDWQKAESLGYAGATDLIANYCK